MDIKIIGAGPGGLITGLMLLEAGFKPTIIEKNKEIISTLCAEGLSKDTLERVPFGPWDTYAQESFEHATFIFPSNQKTRVEKSCLTMDRVSWFRAMAEKFKELGGILILGNEVKDLNDLKYDVLIDSSGPLSWISRKIVGNTLQIKPGVQYKMKLDFELYFIDTLRHVYFL